MEKDSLAMMAHASAPLSVSKHAASQPIYQENTFRPYILLFLLHVVYVFVFLLFLYFSFALLFA